MLEDLIAEVDHLLGISLQYGQLLLQLLHVHMKQRERSRIDPLQLHVHVQENLQGRAKARWKIFGGGMRIVISIQF